MQSDKPHITDFELKKFFSFFATQKKTFKNSHKMYKTGN